MKRGNISQVELAQKLGVTKAYISMIISGVRTPSKRIAERLEELGVNLNKVNYRYKMNILSHARLPVPALPHVNQFYTTRVPYFKNTKTFLNTRLFCQGCFNHAVGTDLYKFIYDHATKMTSKQASPKQGLYWP
jgi:transcriptional regulator with XRE-family HTH domain